ncbi:MAG: hypothetical protein IKX91_06000, partial [Firmicutes bacterium]|nr:hypothetical protein [Bacillota bacterium]
ASAASTDSVPAVIPRFPVTIGGVTLDSLYDEYPVLFFNDITYLPLTYYGCQLLGLYSEWTPESGLIISDMGSKGRYIPYTRTAPNPGTLTAVPATGKISIKGVPIDNAKEEWPFLIFRNVTYIPLTWRNMHDILGCDYAWDPVNGLVIDRADAASAENVIRLPLDEDHSIVQAYAGYFWYYDSGQNISRTPMTGDASELVYEMPKPGQDTLLDPAPHFFISNDKLYCSYIVGSGATMSSRYLLRLNPDGTVTSPTGTNVNPDDGKIYQNAVNGEVLEAGSYTLIAHHYPAQTYANLAIRRDGDDKWSAFGEPGYLYGSQTTEQFEGGFSYTSPTQDTLYEANGRIYTLAHNSFAKANPDEWTEETWYDRSWTKYYDPNLRWPQHSRVCSIDPATGATKFLTPEYADALYVDGDTVYYLTSANRELMACDLDGSNLRGLSPSGVHITQFRVVNGTIYYALGMTRYMVTRNNLTGYEEWAWRTDDCLLFVLTEHGPKQIGTTPVVSMDVSEGYFIARLAADSDDPASDPIRLAVYEGEDEIYTLRGVNVTAAGVADGNLYFVLR